MMLSKWKCLFRERSLNSTAAEHQRGEDGLLSNVDQAVTTTQKQGPRRTSIVPVLCT